MGIAGAKLTPLGAAGAGAALPASQSIPEHPGCWDFIPQVSTAGALSQGCSQLPAQHLAPNWAQQHHRGCERSTRRHGGSDAADAAHARPLSHGDRRHSQVKQGPPRRQAGLHGPYTTPCPSVRPRLPSARGSRPGRGCCEWGPGGCGWKRHSCGGGGEDAGQEAPSPHIHLHA